MKIKTKLLIIGVAYLLAAIGFAYSINRGISEIVEKFQKQKYAYQVVKNVFYLNSLQEEYLKSRSDRIIEQWELNCKILKNYLEDFQRWDFDPEQVYYLNLIKTQINRSHRIFLQIIEITENYNSGQNETRKMELIERLSGQIRVRMREMASASTRLANLVDEEFQNMIYDFTSISVIIISVMSLIIIIPIFLFRRQALMPLMNLQEGIHKLKEGNLKIIVPQKNKNDEIGEIIDNFNSMSETIDSYYKVLEREIDERVKAEESAKRNERLYMTLAQNIPGSDLYLFDKDMRFLIADGSEMRRIGLGREYFENRTLYEAFDENAWKKLIPIYKFAINGEYAAVELALHDSIYSIRAFPIRNDLGEIIAGMAISQNITEKKEAEEREKLILEERENLLSRLQIQFESMPIGCLLLDLNLNVIEINPAGEQIFGFKREEIAGKSVFGSIASNNIRKELNEMIVEMIERRIVGIKVNENTRKDGTIIICKWNNVALRDNKGAVIGILSMAQDVTEEKRKEEELRKLTNYLKAIIDSAPLAIIDIDLKGNIISLWNSAAEKIFGWTKEEVIGKTLPFIPDDKLNEFEKLKDVVFKGETLGNIELRRKRKDGEDIDISLATSALYNDKGEIYAIMGIIADITEKKRVESEIIKLNEDLEERVKIRTEQLAAVNKELEAFAYSVSHDLRAPLRHIDGFLDLLKKKIQGNIDSQSERYMSIVLASSKKMGQLIDDLLAFSRTSRADIHFAEVDMNKIINDIISESEDFYENRTILWEVNALPKIKGDASMLRIVWANLINNAIKFSSSREKSEIKIDFFDAENEIIFYIRDNGVGFDSKYMDKLFGVFQRLHKQEEFEGTGIGLATVKRIITRHGGRIWADGEINKGAVFYFSIMKHSINKN